MNSKEVRDSNRAAWNRAVEKGDRWTLPITPEEVSEARKGNFDILLTPSKPVPKAWFPNLKDIRTLCLASGGGQQAPLLAAAGAQVTSFDNSPKQLAQDKKVAERESIVIETVEGDMADLSSFSDNTFGLIVHPVSNVFVPDVRPVWRESFRVLKPGGVLLAGVCNPAQFIFDLELAEQSGELVVKYKLPYADTDHLSEEEIQQNIEEGSPLEFSHTLEDQLGGQLDAGLVLTNLFEDSYSDTANDPLSKHMPTFIATRAIKP